MNFKMKKNVSVSCFLHDILGFIEKKLGNLREEKSLNVKSCDELLSGPILLLNSGPMTLFNEFCSNLMEGGFKNELTIVSKIPFEGMINVPFNNLLIPYFNKENFCVNLLPWEEIEKKNYKSFVALCNNDSFLGYGNIWPIFEKLSVDYKALFTSNGHLVKLSNEEIKNINIHEKFLKHLANWTFEQL